MKKVINEKTIKAIVSEALSSYLNEVGDTEKGQEALGKVARRQSNRGDKKAADRTLRHAQKNNNTDSAKFARIKGYQDGKDLNETISKAVNEAFKKVVNEISWQTKKKAYDASMVDSDQFPGLKQTTSRTHSIGNAATRTTFENDTYKIVEDIHSILFYQKETGDRTQRDYQGESRFVYDIERDEWTQPTLGAKPTGSQNDKNYVEAIKALCMTINNRRQEYNLEPSKESNLNLYFDANFDQMNQSRRDMEDFQNIQPAFGDNDWRVRKAASKVLVQNQYGTIKQEWPVLIASVVTANGGFGGSVSNYKYNYEEDAWYDHSGAPSKNPVLDYNGETKQLARTIVQQINKFRQLKGLGQSKYANINIYFG